MTTKLQKYSSYKNSGVKWLGEIPEYWETKRIKHLFKEINERSFDGSEDLLSVSQYTGVTNKSERLEEGGMLTNASTLEGYKKVWEGDLVSNIMLAWNGSLGFSPFNGITSPAYSIYRLKTNDINRYFHYLLRTELYKSEFKRNSSGVIESRLRLYTDDFFRIESILPPIEEQTAIANFLDDKTAKIDQAIAIKQKQIELLKERRQILIHKAVTRGLNGTVKLKDSGVEWIGEIPEHWEVKKLKYVAIINYGISPHEKTYNDIGEGSILINGPAEYSETEFGYTKAIKWTTAPVKFAKKGSLLFCLRGSTTGRLNICHNDLSIGRGCAAIMAIENHDFLIKSIIALKDRIIETFKGSTFPSVTSSDLDNYSVPNPPLNEQIEIAEFIETATTKISTAISLKEKEIEKLKEYKASLINSAVTGKVKVS
jgi:type I restriction enzyme S subunit